MLLKMTIFQCVLGGFDVIFGKVLAECGDFVVAFRCGIEVESPVAASAPPPPPSGPTPSPLRSRERGETREGGKSFSKQF